MSVIKLNTINSSKHKEFMRKEFIFVCVCSISIYLCNLHLVQITGTIQIYVSLKLTPPNVIEYRLGS